MGDDDHIVAALSQAIRQLVYVALYASNVGVEEVGNHAYIQRSVIGL